MLGASGHAGLRLAARSALTSAHHQKSPAGLGFIYSRFCNVPDCSYLVWLGAPQVAHGPIQWQTQLAAGLVSSTTDAWMPTSAASANTLWLPAQRSARWKGSLTWRAMSRAAARQQLTSLPWDGGSFLVGAQAGPRPR